MSKPSGIDHAASETSAVAPEHGITIQDASAWILRIGVVSSVLVMLVGLVLSFAHHSLSVAQMSQTRFVYHPGVIWRGLIGGHAHAVVATSHGASVMTIGRGQAVIELGIYMLVLTPIVRVATSMVLFLIEERDWLYTVVTFLVLMLTLTGLLFLN